MPEQERAKDRHERILDAALRVFAKKGYRDAAVDDIVAESKTSKGGVYFHFPGKQAIFLELLDRTAARLRRKIEEAIASRSDPVEKADAALLAVLNTFASHRTLARLFMVEALGAGREFHRRLAELHEEFALIIKSHLDDAVAQGIIDPVDTDTAARAWFGALNQVLTNWVLSGRPGRVSDTYAALRPLLMRSVGVGESRPAPPVAAPDLAGRLLGAISDAREKASSTGREVLLNLTLPWQPCDLVQVAAASSASPRILWEQPSEGFAFAALGCLQRFEAGGSNRFEEVERAWADLRSRLFLAGDPDIAQFPVALAGFSFDDAPGQALPEALLLVPRIAVVRTGALYWLRVTLSVDKDSDPEALAARTEADLRAALAPEAPPAAPCQTLTFTDGASEQDWLNSVEALLGAIRRGDIEKVVLARQRVATGKEPSFPAAALRRLIQRYPGCTAFAFDLGDACFAAATPERLAGLEGQRLTVDCLAGSIRRGATREEDEALGRLLLSDGKELHEHAVVVQELVSQVREVATEVAVPDGPTLRRFSNIQHLFTPITAVVDEGQSIIELVGRLHPTPATCGRPREVALRLIREHEGFERGWYAGPVGWLDARGGGDFVVGLRSALIQRRGGSDGDGRVHIYGGSGIVEGSDAVSEHAEATLKMQVMSWALQPE